MFTAPNASERILNATILKHGKKFLMLINIASSLWNKAPKSEGENKTRHVVRHKEIV